MSLKVITQEYILEHLQIKEQLALFDVEIPPTPNRIDVSNKQDQSRFH